MRVHHLQGGKPSRRDCADPFSSFRSPQARIELRKPLFQYCNVFRVRRLELPKTLLVNVRDLARINGFEKLNESVSLLMPILGTHRSLHPSGRIVRCILAASTLRGRDIALFYSLGPNPFAGRAATFPFLPAFALGLRTSLFDRF